MNEKELSGEKALEKLKKITDEVKVAMMCTTASDGSISSRPMSTAGVDEDGSLWFFTNDTSGKIKELQKESELCLCYSKPSDNTYACIMGLAKITDDKKKEKELWGPMLKAWFPEGTDDPNMTLIKVRPYHGEYWDMNSSNMVVFFKLAKAAISGGRYTDSEAHGEMKL